MFEETNGLVTNLTKTKVLPIPCNDIDLEDIHSTFLVRVATFPGRYLGLPLHFRRLRKVVLQPLIDKIAGRLPGWKRKNLISLEELHLPNLYSCHHHLPSHHPLPPKWLCNRINRIIRGFIWVNDDQEQASHGHSL